MLLNNTRLTNMPVLSLHLGGRVGSLKQAVIDPATLRIVAYEIISPSLQTETFLLTTDIRELGNLGAIIDTADEFVSDGDVIKLDEVRALHFSLIGISVRTEDGRRLGKVEGYVVDTSRFEIQQLSVKQGILKGLTDTDLLIHRSQIIEINDTTIIVKSTAQKVAQPATESVRGNFVNPFRASSPQSPQVESSSATSL